MRRLTTILLAIGALATVAADKAADKPDASVTYVYPPQARAIPALREWLDRQAAALRAQFVSDAAADRRDAAKDGRPFNPYSADRTWKVVTDTPRFLSLSLERWEYTGGAHGNIGFGAMVYDRQTGARLTPLSFFTAADVLSRALKPGFCRQLKAQREEKRGGDAASGTSIAEFDSCIDPVKETVILGSSDRQKFDRIGILIAPYEAGPYAEGTYEATLPVTPAVMAAVKPEWRGYFAVKAGTP